MSTLKGVFSSPKPTRRNFIAENMRRLRASQKSEGKSKAMGIGTQKKLASKSTFPKTQMNVSPRIITSTKSGSKNKHPTIKPQITKSTQVERPNGVQIKMRPKAKRKEQKESEMAEYVHQQAEAEQNLSLDLSSNGSDVLEFIKSPTVYTSPRTHRTTASQTIDSKDMDKLYIDGIIRYATSAKPSPPPISNGVMRKTKPPGSAIQAHHTSTFPKKEKAKPPKNISSSQKILSKPSGDADGFVNLNIESHFDSGTDSSEEGLHQDSAVMLQQNTTSTLSSPPRSPPLKSPRNDPLAPPSSYQRGVVPKYLQKRREERLKENEELKKVMKTPDPPRPPSQIILPADPSCPPNHILLPENERKETVKMLRKNYADYVKELNMMPVRTDTLRMQKRKMELEKQLNKLEEGIKLFSRPKVYVKIGI